MLWQIQSWQHCRYVKLRTLSARLGCEKCGNTRCCIEVDHIVPVSLGGTSDQHNLRALCDRCHKQATARLRREKEQYKAA